MRRFTKWVSIFLVLVGVAGVAARHPVEAQCAGDCDGNGAVTISELVKAVNAALNGCPANGSPEACKSRGIITEPDIFRPSPPAPEVLAGNVLKLNDSIYQAPGFGNTFLVVTGAGNVIIDTSISVSAPNHYRALRAISSDPVRYIILTHAHQDHIGGVPLWKETGTRVLAQRNHVEFLHLENRLAAMGLHRSAAQFSRLFNLTALPPYAAPDAPVENEGGKILATDLFDEFYEFSLGGLTFQLMHTPGETPDHTTVWIPEYKIAFPGDNYYISFPNISTLRGSQPRWALDYVHSLDTVRSWKPEILAPSHGDPIYGQAQVDEAIERYRNAILYVHDETVRGMNAGKDVHTLMSEVALPADLAQSEGYGTVRWSVRGIYEGYIGWFDSNVSNMFDTPARSVYPDIVELAGGPDTVAARAASMVQNGENRRALHMADVALGADPDHAAALHAKREAITNLIAASTNLNEQGWLNAGLIEIDTRLRGMSE